MAEFRRNSASWISEPPNISDSQIILFQGILVNFIEVFVHDKTWRLVRELPEDASCLRRMIAKLKVSRSDLLQIHPWADVYENALETEIVAADLRKKLLSVWASMGGVSASTATLHDAYEELAALCEIGEKNKDLGGLGGLERLGYIHHFSWLTQPKELVFSDIILYNFFRRMTQFMYSHKVSFERMECLRGLLQAYKTIAHQVEDNDKRLRLLQRIFGYERILDFNADLTA